MTRRTEFGAALDATLVHAVEGEAMTPAELSALAAADLVELGRAAERLEFEPEHVALLWLAARAERGWRGRVGIRTVAGAAVGEIALVRVGRTAGDGGRGVVDVE
jgi:hypothetical protein